VAAVAGVIVRVSCDDGVWACVQGFCVMLWFCVTSRGDGALRVVSLDTHPRSRVRLHSELLLTSTLQLEYCIGDQV
jgi:hypothetical protein